MSDKPDPVWLVLVPLSGLAIVYFGHKFSRILRGCHNGWKF